MANKETLDSALDALGLEKLGAIHFGTWRGYAVTHNQNVFQVAARTVKNDKQLCKALQAALKERCPKRVLSVLTDGKTITFSTAFDRKSPYTEQITAFLNAATDALRAQGVAPANTCAHCGAQFPDSLCLVGTQFQPVHAACVHNAKEATVEAAQRNQESGSYLTGTIGAILGTLVGVIPSVLTILLTERIYALLFALVPLAAMFGYRLFRGKQSKGSIAIIVVLSILGVFVLQAIVVSVSVAQEYDVGIGEAASVVLPYLFTGEGFSELISDSLMEFLFMVLGIFFAWRYLNQTNTSTVAAANAVASTLRPISDQFTTQG